MSTRNIQYSRLEQFEDLLNKISNDTPILLFPLRIETHFRSRRPEKEPEEGANKILNSFNELVEELKDPKPETEKTVVKLMAKIRRTIECSEYLPNAAIKELLELNKEVFSQLPTDSAIFAKFDKTLQNAMIGLAKDEETRMVIEQEFDKPVTPVRPVKPERPVFSKILLPKATTDRLQLLILDKKNNIETIVKNSGNLADTIQKTPGNLAGSIQKPQDNLAGSIQKPQGNLTDIIPKLPDGIAIGPVSPLNPQFDIASPPFIDQSGITFPNAVVENAYSTELCVRIFPNEIFLDYLTKGLTKQEIADGKFFWLQWYIASGSKKREYEAWQALCDKYPVHRAAWIVRNLKPNNINKFRVGGALFYRRPFQNLDAIEEACSNIRKNLSKVEIDKENLKKIDTQTDETVFEKQVRENIEIIKSDMFLIDRDILSSELIVDYIFDNIRSTINYLSRHLNFILRFYKKNSNLAGNLRQMELWDIDHNMVTKFIEEVNTITAKLDGKHISLENMVQKYLDGYDDGLQNFFPKVEEDNSGLVNAPVAHLLPDRFMFIGEIKGKENEKIYRWGRKVKQNLQIGINPNEDANEEPFLIDKDTSELIVEGELAWMVDYNKAVEAGMAITVPLQEWNAGMEFNYVYVLGIKNTNSKDAEYINSLFNSHIYTPGGIEMLKPGTPTNLVEGGKAAYNSDPVEEMKRRYKIEVEEVYNDLKDDYLFDTERISDLLRLDYGDCWGHTVKYDNRELLNVETANEVLLDYMSKYLRSESNSSFQSFVKKFFVKYVKARGTLPSFRIGNQPYGILPVTDFMKLNENIKKQLDLNNIDTGKLDKTILCNIINNVDISDLSNDNLQRIAGKYTQYIINNFGAELRLTSEDLNNLKKILEKLQKNKDYLHASSLCTLLIDLANKWKKLRKEKVVSSETLKNSHSENRNSGEDFLRMAGLTPYSTTFYERQLIESPLLPKRDHTAPDVFDKYRFDTLPIEGAEKEVSFETDKNDEQKWEDLSLPKLAKMVKDALPEEVTLQECELLVTEFFDLFTYRLDAWFTGLLDHLLQESGYYGVPVSNDEDSSKGVKVFNERFEFLRQKEVQQVRMLRETMTLRRLSSMQQNNLASILSNSGDRTPKDFGGQAPKSGAYGWVFGLRENVREEVDKTKKEELIEKMRLNPENLRIFSTEKEGENPTEYIVAPSLQHALSAAVLRSAYKKTKNQYDDSSHLCVNLTSARTRQALRMIDGIKAGMSTGIILGADLERYLHEAYRDGYEMDKYIYPLRKLFPITVDLQPEDNRAQSYAMQVINGEALLNTFLTEWNYNGNVSNWLMEMKDKETVCPNLAKWYEAFRKEVSMELGYDYYFFRLIERLVDSYDALNDLLLAEGVHRIVQNDYDSYSAIANFMEDGRGNLPEPSILDTPMEYVVVSHKVAVALPTPKTQYKKPMCMAEPSVNYWLQSILGNLSKIWFFVERTKQNGIEYNRCTLGELNIMPIEYLYLSSNKNIFFSFLAMRWRLKHNCFIDKVTIYDIEPERNIIDIDLDWNDTGTFSLYENEWKIENLRGIMNRGGIMKANDWVATANSDAEDDLAIDKEDLMLRYQSLREYLDELNADMINCMNELEKRHEPCDDETLAEMYKLLCACVETGLVNSLPKYKSGMFIYTETDPLEEDGKNYHIHPLYQKIEFDKAVIKQQEFVKSFVFAQQMLAQRMAEAEEMVPTSGNEDEEYRSEQYLSAFQKLLLDNFKVFPRFKLNDALSEEKQEEYDEILRKGVNDDQCYKNLSEISFEEWQLEVAEVREGMKMWHHLSMFENMRNNDLGKRSILQTKSNGDTLTDKWLGCAVEKESELHDVDSLVIYNSDSLSKWAAGSSNAGIIIDTWTEFIPYMKQTAGMVFHCDQPDNEAPQALLLAIHPEFNATKEDSKNWALKHILELLDSTKFMLMNRAVEPDHIYNDPELSTIFPLISNKIT